LGEARAHASTLRGMLLLANRAQAAVALSLAGIKGNPSSDCDFCGTTGARWRYLVDEVETAIGADLQVRSVGNWAACDRCYALIQGGDWKGLLSRSLEYLGLAVGSHRQLHLTQVLVGFQDMFREGMHGDPTRVH